MRDFPDGCDRGDDDVGDDAEDDGACGVVRDGVQGDGES